MDTLLTIISSLCLLTGSFLLFSGGVGILRFPDFYSRMHAAGITDTLATTMILLGLLFLDYGFLVNIKLIIILLMTLFISPTASHALANAAMHKDIAEKKDLKTHSEAPPSNP